MSREEIYGELNKVFQEIFDDDTLTVNDSTTSSDIEDWDSLEHINLMMAIEEAFGITFNIGEVTTMKNVGEMADNIAEKIK